ncbi:MAG: hypothetical protein Kow0098_03200 [Ignavibacteriaceae bacterium]
MKIGSRLKDFLKERFGTIADAAESLKIKREQLYPYFNDEVIPGADFLLKLHKAGCDIVWLLTGTYADSEVKYQEIEERIVTGSHGFLEFPVLAKVPAGNSEVKEREHPDYRDLYFDPRSHFWLEIDDEYGFSMSPTLQPGDRVLCSTTKKFKDGDIVAVRWDKTKGAIKVLVMNPEVKDTVTLDSINSAERPIIVKKKQIEQIYKVVLIWKG